MDKTLDACYTQMRAIDKCNRNFQEYPRKKNDNLHNPLQIQNSIYNKNDYPLHIGVIAQQRPQ